MNIPYSTQSISQDDIDAVLEALCSPWLTQGPTVEAFGEELASYTGAQYGVAVSNGTAALHLCCLALGISEKSLVWTVPNSFVASANCARYVGASVDFVDIDSSTYCMSLPRLEEKLLIAEKTGRLPDLLIPVHHSGFSVDMETVHRLAKRYKFKIVEDASHALGGTYKGEKVGCCTYSDMAITSFHPVKSLTTGEGGMILTNDKDLARAVARLRTHGITRDEDAMVYPDGTPWHYEQISLGYNYRITDIQSALGLSQLKRLDSWVEKRNELAYRYDELLSSSPIKVQTYHSNVYSARHLYVIRIPDGKRDEIGKQLRGEGIIINVHYEPIHLQPYYRKLGFEQGDFPEAEAYGQDALSIPLFPALTFEQQNLVVERLLSLYDAG